MKLVILFMTVSFMHVSALTYSQKVTITGENMTVEKVFKEIEKQTDLSFFYRSNEVKEIAPLSLHLNNVDYKQVLDRVFINSSFEYLHENNTIIVNKKPGKKISRNQANRGVGIQQKSIKGKVVDVDGEALIGATIRVKGKNTGTATDVNGEFVLNNIEPTDVLMIRYTGFESQDIVVGDQTNIQVSLTGANEGLSEVVVTGYQTLDKRTFTGSVGKVEAEDLATGGSSDIGKALQGMVAGVSVENTSGTFGTKSKIRIRGNSSISGNQEPIWVVDGIVLDDPVNINPNQLYSGDASTMLSSAISGINPDDIEEIQILKDASATAMYGTQAVNGVIVVTTKKGKVGKPTVGYRNSMTLSIKPTIENFNVMNSEQRMEFSEEMFDKNLIDFPNLNKNYGMYGMLLNDLSTKKITWQQFDKGIARAKTFNTDWFDVLFKDTFAQEHSLSVSSGTEKAQFYFSGSYFNDGGQTKNQDTERYTANLKANFNLTDKFTLLANLYGSVRDQNSFGTFNSSESNGVVGREFDINPYSYAMNTSRAMRPYDDDGGYEYYQMNYAPFNILDELDNNFINIKAREIRLQMDAKWEILDNLVYHGIASGRLSTSKIEHVATENSNVALSYRAMESLPIRQRNPLLYNDPYSNNQYPTTVLPRGGLVIVDNNLADFYTLRNSLNWKQIVGENHSFDVLAGSELRHRKYDTDYYKGYGYNYYRGMVSTPDYLAIQRDILGGSRPYYQRGNNMLREASFFANMAYSYKYKYNLTLSARADGSNRLGSSQKFRFLPIWVVGGSWSIDDEDFLKDQLWIDLLKLRGSYGLRGNISGLGSPEMIAYYGTTTRFEESTVENAISVSSPDNPNLQWEKEKMLNVALEFGFLQRFNTTLEYYRRDNYDLIGSLDVSSIGGFSRKTVNWADMVNDGIEVTLRSDNLKNERFSWSSILTYGYNRNKITKMAHMNTILQATVAKGSPNVGYPVNGLYSIRFAGLNNEGLPLFFDRNDNATIHVNKYTRDLSMLNYEGSREPLASGGITNQFKYDNLHLSFLFTYAYGNRIRLNPFYKAYYDDISALDAELSNRWRAPGNEDYTNVPRLLDSETRTWLVENSSDPYTYYNRSDIRAVDGSYIRLKNIIVRYDLPKSYAHKLGLRNIQLHAQGQNLILWADSRLNGQDPEALVSGISMPTPSSYTFGLNVNF